MSSIVNKPHPRTLAEIEIQPIDPHTGYASCGCHKRGGEDRWWLCPYHLGVDEGHDERQELIDDLRARINKAVEEIALIPLGSSRDLHRFQGQIEGLRLVQDWLRSYSVVSDDE